MLPELGIESTLGRVVEKEHVKAVKYLKHMPVPHCQSPDGKTRGNQCSVCPIKPHVEFLHIYISVSLIHTAFVFPFRFHFPFLLPVSTILSFLLTSFLPPFRSFSTKSIAWEKIKLK